VACVWSGDLTGVRDSGSSDFRYPQPPTWTFSRFLGPEVPRILEGGTPHAKLKKIKELHEVEFKAKEQNSLAVFELDKGWNYFSNHEISKCGK